MTRRQDFTDEFKREAVRLSHERGRTMAQVAPDLGVGKSSLGARRRQCRDADLLAGPHENTDKELARLRRENALLRQERDRRKKGRPSSHV